MTCFARGTPSHHRQLAAQAAKVFAGTAIDLCGGASVMKKIRGEFREGTKGFTYDPLVPKSQLLPAEVP